MLSWMKSWFRTETPRRAAGTTVLERRPVTRLQRALVATVGQHPMEVVLLSRTEVVLAVKQGQPAETSLEVRFYNPRNGAIHLGQVKVVRVLRGFDGNWQLKCAFTEPLERTKLAALLA